jgi:hypothetical protein
LLGPQLPTETIALAELSLQLSALPVQSRRSQLGYFQEEGARDMVFQYAKAMARTGHVEQHRAAAELLVDHFFESIEDALNIAPGGLWSNEDGRRFAGYAPVLRTLGGVIAATTNVAELDSRLQQTQYESAWGVIDTVCQAVLLIGRQQR